MLYLTEGDYINAGLSALSIIPGADAIDLEKHLPKKLLTEEAEAFAKKADKVADDVVEDAAKAIKSGSDTTRVGRWMSQDKRKIIHGIIWMILILKRVNVQCSWC